MPLYLANYPFELKTSSEKLFSNYYKKFAIKSKLISILQLKIQV
jgi:hypothetical protein